MRLEILKAQPNSATVALGVTVVADIVAPHERGKYSGVMLTGYISPLLFIMSRPGAEILQAERWSKHRSYCGRHRG